VSLTTLRNIGIILLIALAVYALPGGGTSASIVEAVVSIAFLVAIWLILMRLYREHRMTLFSLGDRHRGILYASFCGVLFAGASGGSTGRWWDSGPLTLLWIALLLACFYGFYAVFRHWREYA
jgi:hypothetical protein